MREIKFRAWDNEEKNFIHFDCINGLLSQCDNQYYKINIKHIEQFTGLHDCEGIEIYEHDLIEITTPDGDRLDIIDEIVYSDIHAAFFFRTRHVDVCSFIESDYTFKKIGNIHEA